jgi:hypothetical protein
VLDKRSEQRSRGKSERSTFAFRDDFALVGFDAVDVGGLLALEDGAGEDSTTIGAAGGGLTGLGFGVFVREAPTS